MDSSEAQLPTRKPGAGPTGLKWYERALLQALAGFMGLWLRTLRFRMDAQTRVFLAETHPIMVGICWHNRLFPVSELYRRYFKGRRVAAMVSASKDGAYMTEFFRCFGIGAIRGSQNRRGVQALKELIKAARGGWDIAMTPDGSRGPIYVMKPGAMAIALKLHMPLMLVSFNYKNAWRFKSWDRFYLPKPFSELEVKIDWEANPNALGEDARAVCAILQERLMAITEDDELELGDAEK